MRGVLERIGALPNVEAATAAADLPLDGSRMGLGGLLVPGAQPPRGQTSFRADWNVVEPGFFGTLKLALLRGRDFTVFDTSRSAPVAIVNEALARRFWPGQDPVGKHMVAEDTPAGRADLTVVGVAADARLMSRDEAAMPYVYVPLAQQYLPRMSLLVRTTDGRSSIPQVRAVVRNVNVNLPVTQALRLSEVTAIDLVPQRIAASAAGSLGVVGLLLAAMGLYGVMSYSVTRRSREISIRMALGASSAGIVRLVIGRALVLTGVGIAIGVLLAAAASRALGSLLFGVGTLDAVAFGGACLLFGGVTLAASYVPARRASVVDPALALRSE